jgi:hypothetical protein
MAVNEKLTQRVRELATEALAWAGSAAVAFGTIAYGIFLWMNGFWFRFGRAPEETSRPAPM